MGASDYLAFSARLTSKESERSTATSFVPELTTAESTFRIMQRGPFDCPS